MDSCLNLPQLTHSLAGLSFYETFFADDEINRIISAVDSLKQFGLPEFPGKPLYSLSHWMWLDSKPNGVIEGVLHKYVPDLVKNETKKAVGVEWWLAIRKENDEYPLHIHSDKVSLSSGDRIQIPIKVGIIYLCSHGNSLVIPAFNEHKTHIIEPQVNRMVLLDGHIPHAVNSPKQEILISTNTNYFPRNVQPTSGLRISLAFDIWQDRPQRYWWL